MKKSKIVLLGVVSLIVAFLDLGTLAFLWRIDTDSNRVNALKTLIGNEGAIIFEVAEPFDEVVENNNSISSILNSYGTLRVEIEFGYMSDAMQELPQYLRIESKHWRVLYEELLPSLPVGGYRFLSSYIRCAALYDCLMAIEQDDGYWQARAEIFMELRKYEPYMYRDLYKFLYMNMPIIVFQLYAVLCVLFGVNTIALCRYYTNYRKLIQNCGSNKDGWHYDPGKDLWYRIKPNGVAQLDVPPQWAVDAMVNRFLSDTNASEEKSE